MKFHFQQLEIYKKAKYFHLQCKALINKKNIKSYSKDQLQRASFSVVLNIAEGSGRFSKPDRKNFFIISRSSIFECVAIIDILKDENILEQSDYVQLELLADEISRILYKMIDNLKG
jgi:four helix bundle protein